MPEFTPITSLPDLEAQDVQSMQAGFYAGYHNAPEPHSSALQRGFHHGWLAGQAEAGHGPATPAQALLVHLVSLGQACTDRALNSDEPIYPIQ